MEAFDGNRGGFAAADAEAGYAARKALALERGQERHDQARAGRADRMTERAGAAVNIDARVVEAKVAHGGHDHDRERLVDLEQIDVVLRPADLVQQLGYGADRRRREPGRLLRMARMAADRRNDRKTRLFGEREFRHDQRGRAV